MQAIVNTFNAQNHAFPTTDFLPETFLALQDPVPESAKLYEQQLELSSILEHSTDYNEAFRSLHHSSLAHSSWEIEKWSPYMLETALRIAQKWKQGW